MRLWRIVPTLAAALALQGCVGINTEWEGNPIAAEDVAKLEAGTTTRAEVLELFGAPKIIDRADLTGLAERVLARYQGEALSLQIDPSLFNDVYVYERLQTDRFAVLLGFFNYASSDTRTDRLAVFFDQDDTVLGVGWTPGREGL